MADRLVADSHPGPEPAVVLLHGQPGVGADWQWVVPYLEGRYRLLVPDRLGYGRTGGSPGGFAANAAAVAALLESSRAGPAVVVGHSWAGGIALAMATGYPDLVAGTVLVSSVAPGWPAGWEDRLLAAPLIGEVLAVGALGSLGLLVRNRRLLDLADRHLPARAEDALAALGRLLQGNAPVWRAFLTEQRAMLGELPPLGSRLGSISARTVILHGDSDHVVAPGAAESLARAVPGSELVWVAGAGHLLPHDAPEAVAAAVDRAAAG